MLRPTHLVVNLTRLQRNLEAIRAHVTPAQVMVMLKANAYGHGLEGVAPFIESRVDAIGVALVEEAIQLRKLGIVKPVLVAGATLPEQLPCFIQHGLTLTASSPALLDAAESAAAAAGRKIRVHLKIDTGMERVGVHEYEAEPFLEHSLRLPHVEVEGIYSHFANSEAPDLKHARLQLERFQEALRFYERRSLPVPVRHMANSGAILQLPESHMDLVRPGVMFYGIYPHKNIVHSVFVQPALTWKSRVAYSKITQAERPVSYGSNWQSDHDVRIVTVPCGYGDGYFRRMTNRAKVIVNGRKFPQVGTICMDQFMVNLEDAAAEVGDEVVLLGEAVGGERISAEDLAAWAGTNPYEVLTNINTRVPRIFVTEDGN